MDKVKLKKSLSIIIVILFLLAFVSLTGIKEPIVGNWKLEAMMDGDAIADVSDWSTTVYHFEKDGTGYSADNGEIDYYFTWENTHLDDENPIYKVTNDGDVTFALMTNVSGENKLLFQVTEEKYFVFGK